MATQMMHRSRRWIKDVVWWACSVLSTTCLSIMHLFAILSLNSAIFVSATNFLLCMPLNLPSRHELWCRCCIVRGLNALLVLDRYAAVEVPEGTGRN